MDGSRILSSGKMSMEITHVWLKPSKEKMNM